MSAASLALKWYPVAAALGVGPAMLLAGPDMAPMVAAALGFGWLVGTSVTWAAWSFSTGELLPTGGDGE